MAENKFDSVNIVIDIGSSSIRVIAFTIQGKAAATFKRDYETHYPLPGWAEQNTHDWEKCTIQCLSELVKALPTGIKINGLSVTGQCPTYVPVDKNLQPLGNALTYQDNRSIQEAEFIENLVGCEYIHNHSGHGIEPFFILPKLLWHKNNDPKLYESIRQVLQPADYLEYFLTGNIFTDPAYACGTLAYDRTTGHWNLDLLNKLGIDVSLFPEKIIHAWDVVGEIKNEITSLTGLPKGLTVIRGGPDSQCCSLGVNAIEPTILSNMSGTSTCLNRTLNEPMPDLRVGNYAHVIPERWSAEVGLNTTGVSLKKMANMLFTGCSEQSVYDQAIDYANESPAGSHDLLFFPYLSNGERDNQNVKGSFYNLSMMTSKEDMIRAVLEGVAFAEKERAGLLTGAGEKFSSMRISGGGASSDLWCQIKSDVMNIPVSALKNADAAELGASILVTVGTKLIPDFTEAVLACDLQYDEFSPNAPNAALYAEKYESFLVFERSLSLSN